MSKKTVMKKAVLVAIAISVIGLVTHAADAEKKTVRRETILEKYDKNKNGKLDPDEREALRKDREAERIKRFDKNGDGKLDAQEEAAARAEMRKHRISENAPAKEAPAKDAPAKKDAPAAAPAK